MNDDFGFELRSSWRQFDVPDAEQAREAYARTLANEPAASQPLLDQATGVLMGVHSINPDTAHRLLLAVARMSHVAVPDLARAVVDLSGGAETTAGPRAAEVAKARLLAAPAPAIDLREAAPRPPVAGGR